LPGVPAATNNRLVTPEHETPHVAHGTGHRWLDLTLALSAMFVSIVSLTVAVHHGNAMDRLVAANSWPFLMYDTDNIDPQGHRRISLKVENAGVGPARIQTFEVWWQDRPVATAPELLSRCCMTDSTASIDPSTARSLGLVIGEVASRVMRAGDAEAFLSLELKDANADIWHRLDVARVRLKMRACYCSVFDECWETDLVQTSAKRVRNCPAANVPFTLPRHWFESPPAADSGAH
jgi:hypothetical protein